MSSPAQARLPALPFLLVLAVVAACLSVSSQSLWVDEAQTALKVLQPTMHGAWQALYVEHNSNMQMPLHMTYIWVWGQVFGASELSLRASNLLWFFIGFFSILHFLRRHPSLRNMALLIFCIHPFIWYYLNEARTYAMETSGGIVIAGALFDAMDRPQEPLPVSWWWWYGTGLLIVCGASVVGVPWAALTSLLLITLPCVRRSIGRSILPALVFIPLLVLLALYYAWTFKEKVRNAYLPMTFPSMLSVFYELFGFLGLGPGRVELRANSVSSTRPFLVPLALLGVPLAFGLILAARKRFFLTTERLIPVLLLTGIPVILTFVLGLLRHARMLARHFAPLFPFILLAETCAVIVLWKSGYFLGRVAAILIILALACSSLELRFAPRHTRDDNRSAAAAALQFLAQHKTVWWAADSAAAKYYNLPLSDADQPGFAFLAWTLPAHVASPPDEIFFCKPDLYDPSGRLAAFIAAHHYFPAATWQSFTLWQKPSSADTPVTPGDRQPE